MEVTPATSRRSVPAVCGIGSVVGGLLTRAVGFTVKVWPHLWHLTGTPTCFSATWHGVMQWGQWARIGTTSLREQSDGPPWLNEADGLVIISRPLPSRN